MIDETDRKILKILQQNARTSNAEIARQVEMAPSGVLLRLRRLEENGVIQKYETRVSPRAVDRGFTAFTFVNADEQVGSTKTGQKLAGIPGVQEVHYTAGSATYLLKLRVSDAEALANMLSVIGNVTGVRSTNSVIVLKTLKETIELPLSETE
jgi:Lrp/AsnC family leucine-responsive transcriptional regulator